MPRPVFARPAQCAALGLFAVGVTGYGLNLRFYLLAQRAFGAASTGSVFAFAPFIGAAFAVVLGDQSISWLIATGSVLMLAGVVLHLHLVESHGHEHEHEPSEREHAHVYDDGHHGHVHNPMPTSAHSHWHRYEPIWHAHSHIHTYRMRTTRTAIKSGYRRRSIAAGASGQVKPAKCGAK